MKQLIDFFVIALLLSITFSCNDDSLLNQKPILSNQLNMTEKKDIVQTFGYCYGCLPMITVYHSYNRCIIAWSGYHENPDDHPVTISYKVDGISGSQRIGYNSGEISNEVYSESYIATWSVKCGGGNECSPCKESGSFFKSASGETEFGSVTDCHKEYLSYSVEKVSNQSNMFDLVLEDYNGNLSDTERYMGIDEMRTYLVDSYSGYEYENYSGGAGYDVKSI